MRASDRSGLAVVLAVLLATNTLNPLTTDRSFHWLSWLLILVIGMLGIGLRRARMGGLTVAGAQVLILVGYVMAVSMMLSGEGVPWHRQVFALYAEGAAHMQTQASPMAPNNGVVLILVSAIGVIMVLTDILVSGIHKPVWAIGPTATLFLVPAIGLSDDTGIASFLYVAIGYLAILIAEGLNSTARWTRGLSRDSADGFGTATPVVWRAAALIGVPALVGAMVLATIMPTLSLNGWGFGNGSGRNGPLQLTDPTLDLRRNLNRPADELVMTYTTDQPDGSYLRMASLPVFDDRGWQNAQVDIEEGNQLPSIPGVGSDPDEVRTTAIKIVNFQSIYLPLPYAPRSLEITDQVATDPNSLVVFAVDTDKGIANLDYTVRSVDIDPPANRFESAAAGTPLDAALTQPVPDDLPEPLIELTNSVVEDADTPVERAAAIQRFLRGSNFSYSTEQRPGTGYQALEDFLLRDRQGYCEQFAGAMAMMARIADIPSRVAVGFLPGTKRGDVWEVSSHDMHAWPELFFAGYGWVRFEPTPSSVTGTAPDWTVPTSNDPGERPTDDPAESSTTAPIDPTAAPTVAPTTPANQAPVDTGFPWGRTLLGTGLGLLALVILAAPATLRIRRRSARLDPVGEPSIRIEAAWSEIRDTVVDLGGSWPVGSPRTIGAEVAGRLEPDDSAAMTQVATLVERSRYARGLGAGDQLSGLPEITDGIRKGLIEPQSASRKLWAVLAPRSLFRRAKP